MSKASPMAFWLRHAQTSALSHPLPVLRAREIETFAQVPAAPHGRQVPDIHVPRAIHAIHAVSLQCRFLGLLSEVLLCCEVSTSRGRKGGLLYSPTARLG